MQIDNSAVICRRAQEHIHAGECILTYGYSKIVEQFLKAAGAKRKFQVCIVLLLSAAMHTQSTSVRFCPNKFLCTYLIQLVVAESNPSLEGHKLASSLCKVPSIGVTLIPDSNIYALMSRVNKVSAY